MLRINLLPREVLDRHRFEGWYRYIFIITTGLVLMVLLIAAALYFAVQSKNDALQSAQESAKQYAEQGKAFDVFEKKEKELASRQTVVQTALGDRINLGKIAEEVSLVLPDEVWLNSFNVDQKVGLSFVGNTPRSGSESMNIAYKSVAKTLVRLNQLPDVKDVWLSTASNAMFTGWDAASNVTSGVPVVQFTTTAKVLAPTSTPAPQAGK